MFIVIILIQICIFSNPMKSRSNSLKKYRKTEEFKENYFDQNEHYLERAPFSEYTDEPFTFDDSPNKTRKFTPAVQFSQFDGDAPCQQMLAMGIIEENNQLKERVRESEGLILQLQNQLKMYRNQIANKQAELAYERGVFQKKMSELRGEIVTIMLGNKKVEGELSSLRTLLHDRPLPKLTRSNIKSLDRFCLKDLKSIQIQSSNAEGKKIEELMDSIRNMHLKIMGFRADNLKDLWRWLKSIGQTYSYLRRWRDQYADINPYSRMERISEALWEVMGLLD